MDPGETRLVVYCAEDDGEVPRWGTCEGHTPSRPCETTIGKGFHVLSHPSSLCDKFLKKLITLICTCVDRLCTCVWGSEEGQVKGVRWRFSLHHVGLWDLTQAWWQHALYPSLCGLTAYVVGHCDQLILSSSPSFEVSHPKPAARLALPGDPPIVKVYAIAQHRAHSQAKRLITLLYHWQTRKLEDPIYIS